MVKVPPLGLFTTLSCATGGVHDIDPESVAVSPLSAVALAAGLGWEVLADGEVVAVLGTVMVTDACGAIIPSLQLILFSVYGHLPCELAFPARGSSDLVGRASLNRTLVAEALPTIA